jgi:hypothetical protein
MRRRLGVARIYRRALRTLPDSMDGSPPAAQYPGYAYP